MSGISAAISLLPSEMTLVPGIFLYLALGPDSHDHHYCYFVTCAVFVHPKRYEDHYPHSSSSVGTVAGTGPVPRALPRPLRALGGAPDPGTLPDRPVNRASQQEL